MAMSFSRPDPSLPAAVADASFGTARRGFDQSEVRDFLRMVAAELGRLQERERFLERELRTAQSNPDLASVQLDDQALTRLLGEETARVLSTARESAVEIRQKAEQAAAQMLSEASDEATRVREEAEIEAARRRADAGADAEAELSMAKQQGREMVNEARAYRERVLSELARRRELAREQIEQLLHGRDRLIQTFERARLAAVDVIAELQPLGEPDEYVNLSPTTGPVPVMVPNAPRPDVALERAREAVEGPDGSIDTDAELAVAGADLAVAGADPDEADATVADGDAATVDTVDTLDEGVDAETIEGDAEVDAEAIKGGDDTASTVDDGADAATVDDGAESGEAAGDESGERDDVVVDLFARLRADTTTTDTTDTGTTDIIEIDDAPTGLEADIAAEATAVADAVVTESEVVDHEAIADTTADASGGAIDDSAEAGPFERREAELTPLIVSSAKRLKRVLADEQNEVLDALRRHEPVRSLDALLPAAGEHLRRYTSAIVDDVLVAANAGATASGRSSSLRKADGARATAAADAVLGEWITLPLRERLERCIADGDGNNTDITKGVRAIYREWKTQHIDDQLDDVFRTAYGRGALAAFERGVPVQWMSDPGHEVCADCNDNTLAGAVPAGDTFPTGHDYAPAHLGCRCLLIAADR